MQAAGATNARHMPLHPTQRTDHIALASHSAKTVHHAGSRHTTAAGTHGLLTEVNLGIGFRGPQGRIRTKHVYPIDLQSSPDKRGDSQVYPRDAAGQQLIGLNLELNG